MLVRRRSWAADRPGRRGHAYVDARPPILAELGVDGVDHDLRTERVLVHEPFGARPADGALGRDLFAEGFPLGCGLRLEQRLRAFADFVYRSFPARAQPLVR